MITLRDLLMIAVGVCLTFLLNRLAKALDRGHGRADQEKAQRREAAQPLLEALAEALTLHRQDGPERDTAFFSIRRAKPPVSAAANLFAGGLPPEERRELQTRVDTYLAEDDYRNHDWQKAIDANETLTEFVHSLLR